MLTKIKKSQSEGFTIIEVMIVLAIAALILLIVLLAVPALQRNSRNTQRKNDVSAIISGITEFTNNNNGTLPTGLNGTNPVNITGAAGSANDNASVGFFNGGTGQQAGCAATATAGHVVLVTGLASGSCSALTNDSAHDYVAIILNAACSTTTHGQADFQARSVAVQYLIESQGGYTPECQGS